MFLGGWWLSRCCGCLWNIRCPSLLEISSFRVKFYWRLDCIAIRDIICSSPNICSRPRWNFHFFFLKPRDSSRCNRQLWMTVLFHVHGRAFCIKWKSHTNRINQIIYPGLRCAPQTPSVIWVFPVNQYCTISNCSAVTRHRACGYGRNRSFVLGHSESGRCIISL